MAPALFFVFPNAGFRLILQRRHHIRTMIIKQHYKQLDGIRGIAILLVVVFHYFGGYTGWFGFMWSGVDLFFVLSGFLITGILLEARQRNGYFKKFYARRILRIFPVYFITLLLFYTYVNLPTGTHEAMQREYNTMAGWFFTYTQNFAYIKFGHPVQNHLQHTWSLAIEEQFYLFWPLLLYCCNRKYVLTLAVGVAIAAVIFRILLTLSSAKHALTFYHPFARFDSFMCGAILVILFKYHAACLRKNVFAVIFFLSLAGLLYGFYAYGISKDTMFMKYAGYSLLAVHFSTWIYFAFSARHQWLSVILTFGVLRFFGKISYGLYLFHWIILVAFEKKFQTALQLPGHITSIFLCLLLSISLAAGSYYFIEMKFLNLKKRFEY
jgi:peptidoglycan/LPS O-acetylase OafA/YrhL